VGTKKTGKGRRKIGSKKRRMRAKIRHRKKWFLVSMVVAWWCACARNKLCPTAGLFSEDSALFLVLALRPRGPIWVLTFTGGVAVSSMLSGLLLDGLATGPPCYWPQAIGKNSWRTQSAIEADWEESAIADPHSSATGRSDSWIAPAVSDNGRFGFLVEL